jgi:hypothetical protein
MKRPQKIVLSASRRTDIPAFYMKWFMEGIERGSFKVTNPYNRHVFSVPVSFDAVHTIVFWSKNYGPFLVGEFGKRLMERGHRLFFNFTINSENAFLEPRVPSLAERLRQLEGLCKEFGSERIFWRFDPICFFRMNGLRTHDNLPGFVQIAEKVAKLGIQRCIISFMDFYPKIAKRCAAMPGFSFVDPPLERKRSIVLKMERQLAGSGVSLHLCCEKALLAALPAGTSVTESSCIPTEILVKISGESLSTKKDAGQRVKQGCGCGLSRDIGSYHLQPCYHNCLFCYANPSMDAVQMARKE